jgi:hypothetical protein
MSIIQKTPLYVYDEPSTYEDFSGGINSDPANENLRINELRDAVNMHYENSTPRNRFGAYKHADIMHEEDIFNVQGIFLFINKASHLVIAADGFLYHGFFNLGGKIHLKKIAITVSPPPAGIKAHPLYVAADLEVYTKVIDNFHTGYILNEDGLLTLVFQNKKPIESVPYNNKLYVATGTRIIEISEEGSELKAKIIEPYLPSGIEYQQIGPNLISPFPELCLNTKTDGVRTAINGIIPIPNSDDTVTLKAVMTYRSGQTADDYRFKWEKIVEGGVAPVSFLAPHNLLIFNSRLSTSGKPISQGRDSIVVTMQEAATTRFRVTFATVFEKDINTNEPITETLYTGIPIVTEEDGAPKQDYQDWVVDRLDGAEFQSATSILYSPQLRESNKYWRELQTCTKVMGDGNKFLFYDDAFNSGNWWKTVIGNPNYITFRGGLNFKTTFNESLIKVINFKGIILAFAFNKQLGGSISIVTGNGDDFPDEGYSPYGRRVVNKNVSTDNPNTVQVAENMILFKYKNLIYMIEGSELNNEIISVQSVNDQLLHKSQYVDIPWEDNNCISEITDNYYSLIWKEKSIYSNGNYIVERVAQRVKMYYKIGKIDTGRIVFPWLRDESDTFNVDFILYIEGNPYHLYDNILIGYHTKHFKDLDISYTSNMRLRGFDMNYPKFLKSLNRLTLYYYRGQNTPNEISVDVTNEAGYTLLNKEKDIQHQDKQVLYTNGQVDTGKLRVDLNEIDIKVFTASRRFPCMLAFVNVEVKNDNDFSLSSITFHYKTKGLPKTTPYDSYRKITRKGESLTLDKDSKIIRSKGDK